MVGNDTGEDLVARWRLCSLVVIVPHRKGQLGAKDQVEATKRAPHLQGKALQYATIAPLLIKKPERCRL